MRPCRPADTPRPEPVMTGRRGPGGAPQCCCGCDRPVAERCPSRHAREAPHSRFRRHRRLPQTDERHRRTRGDGDRRGQLRRRSRHRARFCPPRVGGRRPLPQFRSGRARPGRPDPCGRRPCGLRSMPIWLARTKSNGSCPRQRSAGAASLPDQQRLDVRARRRARCHAGVVGPAPGEQSARPVRADPALRTSSWSRGQKAISSTSSTSASGT